MLKFDRLILLACEIKIAGRDNRFLIFNLFADPPSLNDVYPRNHTVVEGVNVTLQCKVTAANPKPNITWYSVTANNTVLWYGVNLTFTRISRSDAGQYYCVVVNGIGQAVTSRISTIDVQCK